MYQRLIRPILFRLDAERTHDLSIATCEWIGRSPALCAALRRMTAFDHPMLRTRVAGIEFANPTGPGGGVRQEWSGHPGVGALGFGHVEIGSVSGWPSVGNPRPRLFRLPQEQAIVVYYGVPNEGAASVAHRLRGQSLGVPVGINLVKTNDPARPACDEEVFTDFSRSLTELGDCGSYLVLSLSCPNSPGDRDFFDDTAKIDLLLTQVAVSSPRRPSSSS